MNDNNSLLIKMLFTIIGLLVMIILILLGWRITKFQLFGAEVVPPPTSTPEVIPTAINQPQPSSITSQQAIPPTSQNTTQVPSSSVSQPNVVCNQQGYMPPIPAPPPTGCVLSVEWWYPPNPKPCGLWITYGRVEFQQGVAGYWWYEYDVTVSGHIQAFKQKYDYCEVKDFR